MVRVTDSETRRKDVLAATVKSYIKNAVPVSSEYISQSLGYHLSPATIRNVMSELEEMGYLTHPHTSAGRIPTNEGYRFFINNLMERQGIQEEEISWARSEYAKHQDEEEEEILQLSSDIIAQLTRNAGIVTIVDDAEKLYIHGAPYIIEQPEFQNIERLKQLFQIIEQREKLLTLINKQMSESIRVYVGEECCLEEINSCSLTVSSFAQDRSTKGRLAVLGPTRMDYAHTISVLEHVSNLMSEFLV